MGSTMGYEVSRSSSVTFKFPSSADSHDKLNDVTIQFPLGPNVLSSTGISIGTIIRCSTDFRKDEYATQPMTYFRSILEFASDFPRMYSPHQLKSPQGSCRHTLTAGEDGYRNTCNAERAADLCSAFIESIYYQNKVPNLICDLPDDATNIERDGANYCDALHYVCCNRRLFMTSSGRFGLGPPGVKIGDVVTVLFGSNYLCILRPIDLQTDSFECMGNSFISEIMHREAVEEWKAKGGPEEIFHLQ